MKRKLLLTLLIVLLIGTGSLSGMALGNATLPANPLTATVFESGVVAENGSNLPWRLYSDGTLVLDGGFIDWSGRHSTPWLELRSRANIYKIQIAGPIIAGESLARLFTVLGDVTTIEGLEYFDTGNVRDMSGMFAFTSSLTSVGDLSGWDVSNVEDMSEMFSGAGRVADTNNLSGIDGLSSWDVGNVTDMSYMFGNEAGITNLDLSGWDVSNVTNMTSMFSLATRLTNLDLSGWDTGNVEDMSNMFSNAMNLTSVGDLSGWDVNNVEDMSNMFFDARSLISVGDLSDWDTDNVHSMFGMFTSTHSLTSVGDLSGWDVSNVEAMGRMFEGASNLTSVGDLSSWDTSNVNSMERMFAAASSLTSVGDLSGWDVSNVETMGRMFEGASNLTSVGGLSGWDVSNVTNMFGMFWGANRLTNLDLSGWDTGNVTDMNWMFREATSLRQLTLGENFEFIKSWDEWNEAYFDAELSPVPQNATFTGYWQNVGTGNIRNPQGAHVFTSAQLMENYNGATMAGTWVWQPVNRANTDFPLFDVFPADWHYTAVRFAFENNIVAGTSPTAFSPNAPLTRGMMVTILYNMMDRPDVAAAPPFDDVSPTAWYADAIAWAYYHDIVSGVGGNRFAPSVNINREQLATIMRSFAYFRGIDITPQPGSQWADFRDIDQISDWALDSLMWANYHGLVSGVPNPPRINPGGDASRAQAAAIIMNFVGAFSA